MEEQRMAGGYPTDGFPKDRGEHNEAEKSWKTQEPAEKEDPDKKAHGRGEGGKESEESEVLKHDDEQRQDAKRKNQGEEESRGKAAKKNLEEKVAAKDEAAEKAAGKSSRRSTERSLSWWSPRLAKKMLLETCRDHMKELKVSTGRMIAKVTKIETRGGNSSEELQMTKRIKRRLNPLVCAG